jgi:hypothetical protein
MSASFSLEYLASRLILFFFTNTEIKRNRSIIVLVVRQYGCKSWSLKQKKEQAEVCDKVPGKICGPKREASAG